MRQAVGRSTPSVMVQFAGMKWDDTTFTSTAKRECILLKLPIVMLDLFNILPSNTNWVIFTQANTFRDGIH